LLGFSCFERPFSGLTLDLQAGHGKRQEASIAIGEKIVAECRVINRKNPAAGGLGGNGTIASRRLEPRFAESIPHCREKRSVLAIAHRGASGHAPENTFAAFRKALAMGAGFIETDLQLSRDARLVAIHDATVNRTTNGQGAVHDLTLAELRRLDAGSWFGSEFAGERIPTIEEILDFAKKHDMVFYLELKPSGSWGGEHALISALRESGEIARTVVISFDPPILANVRKIEPTVMTGLLFDGQISDPLAKAVEIGARQLAVRGSLVTPRLLKEARQRDLQVVCWTVNHPAHMRLLVEAGVDGIISDYPDRLLDLTRRKDGGSSG
jgi:glycerophosphoryl diester phosphodiesterase